MTARARRWGAALVIGAAAAASTTVSAGPATAGPTIGPSRPAAASSVPPAPTITRAGGDAHGAFLSWQAQGTGGSPITGYELTTIAAGTALTPVAVASKDAKVSVLVSKLVNGTAYQFAVAAKNAVGTGPRSALSGRVIPPFPTLAAFVDWQYGDFTGRSATPAEQQHGADLIAQGEAPGVNVGRLRRSADNVGHVDPVARLYFAFFRRVPDAAGLDYWVDRDRAGRSLALIADEFARSSEYTSRYAGLDNRQFVALAYQDVLGRAPDQGGSDYWTGRLDSHARTRTEVMVQLSWAAENVTRRGPSVDVAVTWIDMLRTTPSQATFDSWVTKLTSGGKTVADLIAAILPTDSYAARLP